jgi:ABC-type multidrug transport system fused ATPase/permease subunit
MKPFKQDLALYLQEKRAFHSSFNAPTNNTPSSFPKQPPTPFKSMMKAYGLLWLLSVLMDIAAVAIELTLPWILQSIIQIVLDPTAPAAIPISGPALAFLFFGLSLTRLFLTQISRINLINTLVRSELALSTLVFEKSVKVSEKVKYGEGGKDDGFSEGKILQMVNVDCRNVSESFLYIPQLFLLPAQVCLHKKLHSSTL